MMLPSWNNFLQVLLHLVLVRSNHDERLVRIILLLELIGRKRKKKNARRKKKILLGPAYRCWSSFFGRLFSACLLSVCLCGLLDESLYRFEIEIWSCMMREYNEDEKQ
uniref:DUF4220 domain-containing protein n=1 Tax=Setaria viridis TaxID=4556 RepID=A0A4U6T1K0_SETVI|nr:hypothetical protein SEVIR_9G285400v2 [Setaria viridis]